MLKTLSLSLEVLKMFTKDKPTWGGRELATALNQNHTKIYRILETLEGHDFLTKDTETKKYALGIAIWELGNTVANNFHINELVQPILEKLSENTNESAFLTVLDGEEGLTFAAVEASTTVRFSVSVGSRTPLHAGASYRSILAYMSPTFIDNYLTKAITKYTDKTMVDPQMIQEDLMKIKQQGYAVSEGEYTEDVIAVAIPIFHKETVIGSITISGPKYRIQAEDIEVFIKELTQAREELHASVPVTTQLLSNEQCMNR
ncbi:HTH-type transcriptional regulator KipR [Paraliobacillus sp. PM-2]|uniref:IclR family transcriptional regulator n=1 Tax=Paraliobacillus sp. PM-2 TaxID=1462524 RepID=UPI00061C2DB0|nr:IclR family transcriptional regulator [Paraliobacillus sp. PM-2]CQR46276.1 HTH-type transcriptional regulator KipR [Paraliobacillus sp. PM-2]